MLKTEIAKIIIVVILRVLLQDNIKKLYDVVMEIRRKKKLKKESGQPDKNIDGKGRG